MTTHLATPGYFARYKNFAFMASIDGASLGEIFKPAHWEKIRRPRASVG
jgi:hypothetical protein